MDCESTLPLPPQGVKQLSVCFVNDKEIHLLNRDWRGKDKPTDVLSFSQLEGSDSFIVSEDLGDLIISLDTAKRQARQFGCSLNQELLRLMIHGVLHLFGYDHEHVSKAEANRMRRMEKLFFDRLETQAGALSAAKNIR